MKMKRLLALLLATVMAVSALPMGVFAEEESANTETQSEEVILDETQTENSEEEKFLFFRDAGMDENGLLFVDSAEKVKTSLSIIKGDTMLGCFYYGTEENAEEVAYKELTLPSFLEWNAPDADEVKNESEQLYITGLNGKTYGSGAITYQGASISVEVPLPGAGFFSEPVYSVEYYVGADLPFTGDKVDLEGDAYEVYYYLKRSDDKVDTVTVLQDEQADPSVTAEIVDRQYAKITIKEGFSPAPEYGYDIMMSNSDGGEWGGGFSILDQRESEEGSASDKKLFFRVAGRDSQKLYFEDTSEALQDEPEFQCSKTKYGYFYYGTEEDAVRVPYEELTLSNTRIEFDEPDASDMASTDDTGYLVIVSGEKFGSCEIRYQDASMTVEVVLPSNSFYSAPERSVANYMGNDLPFTGEKVDENGDPYEIYYFISSNTSNNIVSIQFLKDDKELTEQDTGVSVELIDNSYAKITITEGFDPKAKYYIALVRADGKNGQSFSVEDQREEESENTDVSIYNSGIGVYTRYFGGVQDGKPEFKNNFAKKYIRDQVGESANFMFMFWDGETAAEIAPSDLKFPDGLTYEISEDYANAVCFAYDKVLSDYIIYEAGDGTEYSVEVTIKPAEGKVGADTIAYFNAPEMTEDNWNKSEWLTGIAGEEKDVYLMWDPELFVLDAKSDFKIYLEKNEEEGYELPAHVWDDSVDTLLSEYGVTLTLDTDKSMVKIHANFTEVDGTLDFTAFVTDKNGAEYEVQISIDLVTPTVKRESYSPALKWRPVVELNDGTLVEQGELRSAAQLTAMDYICVALYEVDEGGKETPVSLDDQRLETAGRFRLSSLDDEHDHWMNIVSEGTTHGSVNIAESYGSKLIPWYLDTADIDEDALNAVELLYALDVMRGNTDGEFMPDGSVTRAELAKLMYVIMNYGDDDGAANYRGANLFSDVKSEDSMWYEGYVNYCASAGLVQGEDGKFNPGAPVTVVKAAKTILLALGYSADACGYNDLENGVDNILEDAETIGLLDNVDIDVNGNVTRQWLAKMLENMLLKCYTYQMSSNKYYYVPAGVKYFDLTEDSAEYQTVYRAIPLDVVLPFAAFYTKPQRDGDYFAAWELMYEDQPYYVLVEDGWTVTSINCLKDNMEFFHWESVETEDGNTVAKVTFVQKPGSDQYRIEVVAENEQGTKQAYRASFIVLSEGEGQLVWRWVKRNEEGELYAAAGDETEAISVPGDDFEMAFFLLEDGVETPVSKRDLIFPDFVITRWMEDGNEYFFEMEFREYGSGFITYTRDGSIYQMPVECPEPLLNYYSRPEKNDKYNLDQMLMGFYGETKTAYLVWDPEETGEVQSVIVYFKMSNENRELQGIRLEEANTVLAEYGVALTPYLEKGYIQVDTSVGIDKNLELTLCFADGYEEAAWLNIDNEFTATINQWRRDQELPIIEYNGVEYTFGIGRIEGSGKFDMFHAGGGFGATSDNKNSRLQETIYLGAMSDFATSREAAAPAWVYDCISNVTFEIVDYINAHDLSDQKESNIYINSVYQTPMAEMKMHTVDIRSKAGGFAEALLHVQFTVTFPDQEPVECLVKKVVHFAYNLNILPDLSEMDTADELNALLSGGDVFVDWIKTQDKNNGTTMYIDYQKNNSLNWESTFELVLPAVAYDDIITVSLDGVEFGIQGSEAKDGSRTTMPGMKLLNNNYFFMNGIDFVAAKEITQSYGAEVFTCGILSGDVDADFSHCDAYKIHDCTFTGFDYGVRNTPYGYTCVGSNNVFTDCEVGYLIDCTGKRGGNANDSTEYSRFVNCGTAIRIKGLPDYLTPYDYRIYNCDFIGNKMDIDVSQEGRFYFIKNYYGDVQNKHVEVVDDANDVHKRPPRVRGRGYADVVVNPRWRDPVTLPGSNHDSNHLIVDTKHGLVNYMFNDDALEWSFDSSILNTDLSKQTEGVSLAMTDDKEQTLGTWDIAGGETQTQLLSLLSEETTVADTFCPALNIDKNDDGSISVTVDDSDLFDQRKVTLTIPADFIHAAVLLNEAAVESVTANGQVTFTVTNGGTYVISEALTEETLNNSFVSGGAVEEDAPAAVVDVGWYDFNAQQTGEKTSFVSMTTQKQDVVKEVDPNEDLKVEEDENGEWIGEETETTEIVTVQAIYQAPAADVQITVLLVLYDSNGRMVAMQEQSAKQNEGTKVITVECDASLIGTDAVQVRAFVISADGKMSPLAPVPFSQTLEIPQ